MVLGESPILGGASLMAHFPLLQNFPPGVESVQYSASSGIWIGNSPQFVGVGMTAGLTPPWVPGGVSGPVPPMYSSGVVTVPYVAAGPLQRPPHRI